MHCIKKLFCLFQIFNMIIIFDIPSSFVRSNNESWFPSYVVQDINYFTDPHYILFQQLLLQAKNPGLVYLSLCYSIPFIVLFLSAFFSSFHCLMCFRVRSVSEMRRLEPHEYSGYELTEN